MIRFIQAASSSLLSSSNSGPWIGNVGQGAGDLRLNTANQNIEAYDGVSWITISQTSNISLSYTAEAAIRWATEKMREEADIQDMAKKHKAVAAALENLNKAQKQLDVTIILSKEEQ